ncbi:VWA domain-containing protein [Methylicorpusculum sp.]|uniref:VWA domain-containing protein n=1 Tax=Methylicorpusculum sp. TaxID=2713644 RepID=UPI002ABCD8C9|nr:VWA domain-containing protein [Methylicorpusculum sp.]MDZ4152023.1 VWA domain-containing protein [Methylicorpusculum sp.]
MQIRKGQRLPLTQLAPDYRQNEFFQIQTAIDGLVSEVDFSCFGVDVEQRLSDDRYMTFFNQAETPCGSVSVSLLGNRVNGFNFRLSSLPASIDMLVITAAIDGTETMSAMKSGHLKFFVASNEAAEFAFEGKDFKNEKALMLGELYRKDGEWRFCAVGQGFDGGLDALVKYFGGEVASHQPDISSSDTLQSVKLSLEKKIAKDAPKLVDLAKKATISLEKKQLSNLVARVGLVLDTSGSMTRQFMQGRVQEVINRMLPLAVHFDDDGELDVWAFSMRSLALPPATLKNYGDYINKINGGWRQWGMLSYNNEPEVIRAVLDYYENTHFPVLIIFISDGGVDQNAKIKKLLVEAASKPIFWQFVGIGGRNYGILEKLDTMPGRVVDNCGFFALDDLDSVSEQELYDRLLQEFPAWIADAKSQGIIN